MACKGTGVIQECTDGVYSSVCTDVCVYKFARVCKCTPVANLRRKGDEGRAEAPPPQAVSQPAARDMRSALPRDSVGSTQPLGTHCTLPSLVAKGPPVRESLRQAANPDRSTHSTKPLSLGIRLGGGGVSV